MKKKYPIFIYDAEADVLSWQLNGKSIRYAKEVSHAVLHFGDRNALVLIEILEATKLLSNTIHMLEKKGITIPHPLPALSVIQGGSLQ